MQVLVVNTGSSTLKLSLLNDNDDVSFATEVDPWEGAQDTAALHDLVAHAGEPGAVGHRVVHGGERLQNATVVDDDVIDHIDELSDLAPLHQPRAVAGIRVVREILPQVPHVACFDTAFHATLPPAAATYAVPAEWRDRWPIRRFGFHGLSHGWAARRAAELAGVSIEDARIVSCHLGAGASLCAVDCGRSVDTTMGFTPLEGLVMATRSGSVDPGLLLWLIEQKSLDAVEVRDALERHSGLAALAGGDGDMRQLLSAIHGGSHDARLAFDVYVHALRRGIGAMVAVLGGCDIVAFTGGVGEHAAEVRRAAVEGLGYLGVHLDDRANRDATADADVSAPAATVRTIVVTAREDIEIARQTRAALTGG